MKIRRKAKNNVKLLYLSANDFYQEIKDTKFHLTKEKNTIKYSSLIIILFISLNKINWKSSTIIQITQKYCHYLGIYNITFLNKLILTFYIIISLLSNQNIFLLNFEPLIKNHLDLLMF